MRAQALQEAALGGSARRWCNAATRRCRIHGDTRQGDGPAKTGVGRRVAGPVAEKPACHFQDLGAGMTAYPKRLIEVDLPIKRISAHARREKSIRHGHISTLHIWWARRPLAACRAVICASLWPDPADENCPQAFRDAAARLITAFAETVYNTNALHATASKESFGQWEGIVAARAKGIDLDPNDPAHLNKLRFALLEGAIRKNRCLGAGFLFSHTPANNRRFPTLPSQGERPCPSANPANGDTQRRPRSNRGIASRRSGPRSRTSSSRSKPNAVMGA